MVSYWSILIHACARIATAAKLESDLMWFYFDSCMREDCNKIHHRVRHPWRNFNSCMREDCNLLLFGGRVAFVYFDSCMREDCNGDGGDKTKIKAILIHACARIATFATPGFTRA